MSGFHLPLRKQKVSAPVAGVLAALVFVPIVFVATQAAFASRNVAYWDEVDSAIAFLLRLDSGVTVRGFVEQLFAVTNEHRTVTSRLLFAVSYWLTGTVNFSVIGAIGNATVVALCAWLTLAMTTPARRLRLAVVLVPLLFQLEHYENFLWSGSSIDHFLVVLLAAMAVVGVAAGTSRGLWVGVLSAILATFTLAHGLVVWPVGAGMLALQRRWRPLLAWSALGALTAAGFIVGFHFNGAEHFVDLSLGGAWLVGRYWLALLGAVPAMGYPAAAPWLGGALLVSLALIARRGGARRESIALPLALYAIAAMALIAIGRAAEAHGVIHSRYYVLSALAWGLVIFMWLNRLSHPRRPLLLVCACVPALAAFNFAANRRFAEPAGAWLECRDRAAVRFKQHGVDGKGVFALYPAPARSTQLLNEAERRGVYRMPPVCDQITFPPARESNRIKYFVEELDVDARALAIVGWAAIPDLPPKRGQLHIVLRSPERTLTFQAVTVTRPDVAAALERPRCTLSGFRFARGRDTLPGGSYQIGFLITNGRNSEYIMTEHRVDLDGTGRGILAQGQ